MKHLSAMMLVVGLACASEGFAQEAPAHSKFNASQPLRFQPDQKTDRLTRHVEQRASATFVRQAFATKTSFRSGEEAAAVLPGRSIAGNPEQETPAAGPPAEIK